MKKNKLVLLTIVLLVFASFILISIGNSFAIYNLTKKGVIKNIITTSVYTSDVEKLNIKILQNNELITTTPNLGAPSTVCTNSIVNSSTVTTCTGDDAGLYESSNTNDGNSTYYFRGNVENNYVDFAGYIWRIVRINEDGTVRLVLNEGVDDNSLKIFAFYGNPTTNTYLRSYYSNATSGIKTTLTSWYSTNIIDNGYNDFVATGNYFCEQMRVIPSSNYGTGNVTAAVYSSYIPTFKCEKDANELGIVNSNVGLLTYDEVVYAGGYYLVSNNNYYLYNNNDIWLMSPAGDRGSTTYADAWYVKSDGSLYADYTNKKYTMRPVINLNADVTVTGSGLENDMYVVQ